MRSRSIHLDTNVIHFPKTHVSGRMLRLPTKSCLLEFVAENGRPQYPPYLCRMISTIQPRWGSSHIVVLPISCNLGS